MEVTRVAHEVGSEVILGGQAKVKGVAGVWKRSHRFSKPDGRKSYSPGT